MQPPAPIEHMPTEHAPLAKVLSTLLAPMIRLCLANGVTYASLNEIVKTVFVEEADALQPGASEHGKVSRISTATGINRSEVTRLTKQHEAVQRPASKKPQAAELLALWTTEPAYRDADGAPLGSINRLGPAPSFEALAQEVTRSVHHRSLMDELIRLEMVSYDEETDSVAMLRPNFVPANDSRQMLNFLSDNVGDHLKAAVANITKDGPSHLEQAIFADELSAESLKMLTPLIMGHWKALHDEMIPAINALIAADERSGRPQDQRIRIGVYTYSESTAEPVSPPQPQVSRRYRKSPSRGTHT